MDTMHGKEQKAYNREYIRNVKFRKPFNNSIRDFGKIKIRKQINETEIVC